MGLVGQHIGLNRVTTEIIQARRVRMSSKVVCLVLVVLACVSLPQAFASEQETVALSVQNVSVSMVLLALAASTLLTVPAGK